MRIPLNEFEHLIDENILKRGLNYFKGGAVTDFSEISNGIEASHGNRGAKDLPDIFESSELRSKKGSIGSLSLARRK